jgi:hypothetical protein
VFLTAATDVDRYLPIVVPVGAVAECGHALVRLGHVIVGDNPPDDLLAPLFMLLFGLVLLAVGIAALRHSPDGGAARGGAESCAHEVTR